MARRANCMFVAVLICCQLVAAALIGCSTVAGLQAPQHLPKGQPVVLDRPAGRSSLYSGHEAAEVTASALAQDYGTRITDFESDFGDDIYVNIALPFQFWFHGQHYTSVSLMDNGYIAFGPVLDHAVADNSEAFITEDLELGVKYLWNADETAPKMAPMWYDFFLGPQRATGLPNGGSIWVNSSAQLNNRNAVVFTWSNVEGTIQPMDLSDPEDPQIITSTATFQAILYETGQIQFNYGIIDLLINPNHSFMTAMVGVTDGGQRITEVDNSTWGDIFGGGPGPEVLNNQTKYLAWETDNYVWSDVFPPDVGG